MKNDFKSMNLFFPEFGRRYLDSEGNYIDAKKEKPKHETECDPISITVTHRRLFYEDDVKKCKHEMRYRTINHSCDSVEEVCRKCNGYRIIESQYCKDNEIPLPTNWELNCSMKTIFTSCTHIGKFSQDCVIAMVTSGDFTLQEALYVMGNSCERCMNVLTYKYLGIDGYEEYSDEWYLAGTECDFCKDIKHPQISEEEMNRIIEDSRRKYEEKYGKNIISEGKEQC